ncbi:MAG: hypothetical protein PHI97_20960 [Desulfobulbus sp.]|nr:hypothetical protein [Desulfobulbus sp.]
MITTRKLLYLQLGLLSFLIVDEAIRIAQALFNPGLEYLEQLSIFKVWTGFVIGEFPALTGSCIMNSTTFTHFSRGKKHTGAVFSGTKGVSILQISMTHLTVADGKMAGNAIDIIRGQQQRRAG